MKEIARFIADEIKTGKIAEIGIGHYFEVANTLKELGLEVIVIDIRPDVIEKARKLGLEGFIDDIFRPNFKIYTEIRAVYSIRPTPEMMPALLNLAKKLRIPLYIVPLTGDIPPREMKLINYKGIPIYKWEP
ncbi:UPF0146 family protein [Pyrococcus sp. ST04]|uniref:UPF0146 family protein n=1 Tax=Pyrococcus sp. ST04 TaxID=1183377 RepID=UPI00026059C5|nr:UPF0146 family protein [Pyrococcus sp. ST04]AFK21878.1 hypothetical protein Py04_0276 [Pyrococcus sp. ST04]